MQSLKLHLFPISRTRLWYPRILHKLSDFQRSSSDVNRLIEFRILAWPYYYHGYDADRLKLKSVMVLVLFLHCHKVDGGGEEYCEPFNRPPWTGKQMFHDIAKHVPR